MAAGPEKQFMEEQLCMEKNPNSYVRGIHTEGLMSLYISETDKSKRVILSLLAEMCIFVIADRNGIKTESTRSIQKLVWLHLSKFLKMYVHFDPATLLLKILATELKASTYEKKQKGFCSSIYRGQKNGNHTESSIVECLISYGVPTTWYIFHH